MNRGWCDQQGVQGGVQSRFSALPHQAVRPGFSAHGFLMFFVPGHAPISSPLWLEPCIAPHGLGGFWEKSCFSLVDILKRSNQLAISGLFASDVDPILNELAGAIEPVTTHYQWRPQLGALQMKWCWKLRQMRKPKPSSPPLDNFELFAADIAWVFSLITGASHASGKL